MIVGVESETRLTGKPLVERQQLNSDYNMMEIESNIVVLKSIPRRFVLELTNDCNLNCLMCGSKAADFKPRFMDVAHFKSLEPFFDTVEEVSLIGCGEPTSHSNFEEMLEILQRFAARKHFCTSGMLLDKLTPAIFEHEVDAFTVKIDGATKESNSSIRVGADLEKINQDLREIVKIKQSKELSYPYINYAFTAMKKNLHELPQIIEMAADVGLEEVKVVYLTVLNEELVAESLYGSQAEVADVFGKAAERAEKLGVLLKLPYIQGEDPAGDSLHRDCYVAYRDFVIGSDGYVRPCVSTADKFLLYNSRLDFMEMWNSHEYVQHRRTVNTVNMPESCRNCYQSSHCNWNNKKSYIQIGENFAPEWEGDSHE